MEKSYKFNMRHRVALVLIFSALGFAFGSRGVELQHSSSRNSSTSSVSDIRQLIKIRAKGQIVSIDFKEPGSGRAWNPMIGQREVVEAIKRFVPGRKPAEIEELLGKPRVIEAVVPVKGWPKEVEQSEEVWLYMIGPDGWDTTLALCFSNGICTNAVSLDVFQICAYEKWKADTRMSIAPGKTSAEIISLFGEPNTRRRSDDSSLDEMWTYNALESLGMWVGIKDGKCVTVGRSYRMH